jgi:arylsulfatase A-like enzyme
LSDPHFPYDTRRETFGSTFADRPYDAGIAAVDLQVQRLREFLQSRKLVERTLILVVGDHGEGLMEHDEQQHGMRLYNSTLHVPLIVAGPRFIKPGVRVPAAVSLVDVLPTILDVLNIRRESRVRGETLKPALAGNGSRTRVFYLETDFPFIEDRGMALRGLVTTGWKYIQGSEHEVYNLTQDPGETDNVAKTEKSQLKQLVAWFRKGLNNMEVRDAPLANVSSSDHRILAALGYTGGRGEQAPGDPGKHSRDTGETLPIEE